MSTPFRASPAAEQVAVILTRADFKVFLDELYEGIRQPTPEYNDPKWVFEHNGLLKHEPYKTWFEEWRNK